MTECRRAQFEFQAERSKRVVAEFSGERLTSDGGLVVLRELDRQEGIIDRFVSSCLVDQRHAGLVTHRLETVVRQLGTAANASYKLLHKKLSRL